ncbi:NACHT domain-containing protein [Salinarimonas rosea]|uniref:NACHT domain-containing protein n=1 Tax=Salinarimonas rosea TaxID=552063 RepID=UPI0012EB4386|nr:hypothetical protein [Salinarimonas rosea]
MTSAERKGPANGIWLCQTCHKLVDSDDQRYTLDVLRRWKAEAIERAFQAVATGRPMGRVVPSHELDDVDVSFLSGLGLPTGETIEHVEHKLREATRRDFAAFRSASTWPGPSVPRTVSTEGPHSEQADTASVSQLLAMAEPVILVAPGGVGKSTFLLSVGEHMLEACPQIPVLVPLSEWSEFSESIFEFTLRRFAFASFRREHLMHIAYRGGLALLLDGWNELSPGARMRAQSELKGLRRDYPTTGLLISSRRQQLPIKGRVVSLDELTFEAQEQIAVSAGGQAGVQILDRARRTKGLREIVANPLFLHALLSTTGSQSFPETKEAVLSAFIEVHESQSDLAGRLHRDALGHQSLILQNLAAYANSTASTVLSEETANRIISTTMKRLAEEGQIGQLPNPGDVVDGLVGAHALVRPAGDTKVVAFQHHLFQEWYASRHVEEVMRSAINQNDLRIELREKIINFYSWQEAVLFACERLSRSDQEGAAAVEVCILETLGIDPVFAAEMIARASSDVWSRVGASILRFVEKWHSPGQIDRAIRFVITSGKPEFAEIVWPLAGNVDDQVQYATFRAAEHFRVGVLGDSRKNRLRDLGKRQREIALVEIAAYGDLEALDFVVEVTGAEEEAEVIVEVIQALEFRRAGHHVAQILKNASDDVWRLLADSGYPLDFSDPRLQARIEHEREKLRAAETRVDRQLAYFVSSRATDVATLRKLLVDPKLNMHNAYVQNLIVEVHANFGSEVAEALAVRLANGFSIPYRVRDFLNDATTVETGQIAELVLDLSSDPRRSEAAACMVGAAVVDRLVERLIITRQEALSRGRADAARYAEERALIDRIAQTRDDAFFPVILELAEDDDLVRIGVVSELVARHGCDGESCRPIPDLYQALLRMKLERWAELLTKSPGPRHLAANLARAVGRLGDPALADVLLALLRQDLEKLQEARAARNAAKLRSDIDITGYTLSYTSAFAAMGSGRAVDILKANLADHLWGHDAAVALFTIWDKSRDKESARRSVWIDDYSQHMKRRGTREKGLMPTSEFGEAIFDVIRQIVRSKPGPAGWTHAVSLASVGLALPHGNKRADLEHFFDAQEQAPLMRRMLAAAARSGEVIPSALLVAGVKELLTAADQSPWRLDRDRGELLDWMVLFPFADDPFALIKIVQGLPGPYQHASTFKRLLHVIPYGPTRQGLALLEQLAVQVPSLKRCRDWQIAITKLDTSEAAVFLIEQVVSGEMQPLEHSFLAKFLANHASRSVEVRSLLTGGLQMVQKEDSRALLISAIEEVRGEEQFMILFDSCLQGHYSESRLVRALRGLAINRRPVDESDVLFEEYGTPLPELRMRLFSMLMAGDAAGTLAEKCLVTLDLLRDENGRLNDEPRHPDISAGRPWPKEAGL